MKLMNINIFWYSRVTYGFWFMKSIDVSWQKKSRNWKLFSQCGWMSQQFHFSPAFLESFWFLDYFGILKKYVLIPAEAYLWKGQMHLPAQMRPCRQKAKASFFCILLCLLPPEGVSQIFDSSFNLRWSNFGKVSPLQMTQSLTGVPAVCVFVCLRCSKIDNQEQSSLIHIFGLHFFVMVSIYIHI